MGNQSHMPMMMGTPIFQQAPEWHGNDIPARVVVALRFLEQLTDKQSDDAVETQTGTVQIEGIELLPVEQESQAAACKMLTQYFNGTLTPSNWEMHMITMQNNVGTLVPCPNCQGLEPERSRCRICDRVGVIRKFVGGG